MIRQIILSFIAYLLAANASAQTNVFPVTDSLPVTINGLEMGYKIKSAEEKEVSKKGNFSRYAIKFYIRNTSSDAKIILYKDGLNLLNNTSNLLAQFNCMNATGARLTAKSVTLNAAPCNVMADVDDKDANGKSIKNRRLVQIGYWIRSGQSITADAIIIVPLNELPNMQVVFLANSLQQTASASFPNNDVTPPAYPQNSSTYFKIKNNWKGTFVNNQYGPLDCSNIDNDWWSAQWQLVPVAGQPFYLIKNRWKLNFISKEIPGNMLSQGSESIAAMWLLEPLIGTNQYRIKNASDGSYLNIMSGNMQSTKVSPESPAAIWMLQGN